MLSIDMLFTRTDCEGSQVHGGFGVNFVDADGRGIETKVQLRNLTFDLQTGALRCDVDCVGYLVCLP